MSYMCPRGIISGSTRYELAGELPKPPVICWPRLRGVAVRQRCSDIASHRMRYGFKTGKTRQALQRFTPNRTRQLAKHDVRAIWLAGGDLSGVFNYVIAKQSIATTEAR